MNISKVTLIAAATAGVDMIGSEPENRQNFPRTITAIGFVGSAAIGDCEMELVVGNKKEGKYRNTTVGVGVTNPGIPAADKDVKKVDIFVPAGVQVQGILTIGATTNAVLLYLEFGRPVGMGTRGRSSYRRPSGGTRRVTRVSRRQGFA